MSIFIDPFEGMSHIELDRYARQQLENAIPLATRIDAGTATREEINWYWIYIGRSQAATAEMKRRNEGEINA